MAGTVGITYSQTDFSKKVGGVALALNEAMDQIRDIKAYLDQYTAATLETLYGYDAGQGAILKTAFADADQLRTIYEGTAALPAAKDFRAFLKQIYGLGIP